MPLPFIPASGNCAPNFPDPTPHLYLQLVGSRESLSMMTEYHESSLTKYYLGKCREKIHIGIDHVSLKHEISDLDCVRHDKANADPHLVSECIITFPKCCTSDAQCQQCTLLHLGQNPDWIQPSVACLKGRWQISIPAYFVIRRSLL